MNRSFNPQETFQLISDVDQKLVSRKGLFADDEHEAKRQILLARAADAKKRLEESKAAAEKRSKELDEEEAAK